MSKLRQEFRWSLLVLAGQFGGVFAGSLGFVFWIWCGVVCVVVVVEGLGVCVCVCVCGQHCGVGAEGDLRK